MDNCEYFLNKWVVCSIMNRNLPYNKPDDCQKYYEIYKKACSSQKEKNEQNEREEREEKNEQKEQDKIFKCSVFSAH